MPRARREVTCWFRPSSCLRQNLAVSRTCIAGPRGRRGCSTRSPERADCHRGARAVGVDGSRVPPFTGTPLLRTSGRQFRHCGGKIGTLIFVLRPRRRRLGRASRCATTSCTGETGRVPVSGSGVCPSRSWPARVARWRLRSRRETPECRRPCEASAARPLTTSWQALGDSSTRFTQSCAVGSRYSVRTLSMTVSRCTTRTAIAPEAAARRPS